MSIDSLKGLFLDRQDILDIEPGEPNFDRELALQFSPRNRGSVRLSLGLFYTREEWQQRRKELMEKPLP